MNVADMIEVCTEDEKRQREMELWYNFGFFLDYEDILSIQQEKRTVAATEREVFWRTATMDDGESLYINAQEDVEELRNILAPSEVAAMYKDHG